VKRKNAADMMIFRSLELSDLSNTGGEIGSLYIHAQQLTMMVLSSMLTTVKYGNFYYTYII